jgi:hypothetical protein
MYTLSYKYLCHVFWHFHIYISFSYKQNISRCNFMGHCQNITITQILLGSLNLTEYNLFYSWHSLMTTLHNIHHESVVTSGKSSGPFITLYTKNGNYIRQKFSSQLLRTCCILWSVKDWWTMGNFKITRFHCSCHLARLWYFIQSVSHSNNIYFWCTRWQIELNFCRM